MNKKFRGFTLIELLVVITIIGILTSIIIGGLNNSKLAGRDARRISDLKNIQTALAVYYNDNASYPTTLSTLVPNYMATIPKDPKDNTTDYKFSVYNANGTSNCSSNLPSRYHLGAVLESKSGSNLPSDDADFYIGSGSACTGSLAKFHGGATDCIGTALASDNCYDVTQD